MRSLRSRLILSHVLPLLLVVPLIGLAFYYAWYSLTAISNATAVLAPSVQQLTEQAQVVATLVGRDGAVWADAERAETLLRDLDLDLTAVTILNTQGEIVASSAMTESLSLAGETDVATVLGGDRAPQVEVRNELHTRYVRVVLPVLGADQRLLGVLLVSHELATAQDVITQALLLLAVSVLILLAAGVAVGAWLAVRLSHSLERATAALYGIAAGAPPTELPDQQIAEINALYQAVNGLVERLQTLEAARRRLLANLVHELGRPLGSLRAAIHALGQGADADPALRRELLTGMDAQIDRLEPLLADLTELHAQVLGSRELDRRPTPLSPWLGNLAVIWRAAAEAKAIVWRADIPLDLPIASIDGNQLARAIGNLLSNAVKFTPAGGTITLQAAVIETNHEPSCQILVRDTGPGIPAVDRERVFEPFQRGESQQRFPQGMGLGLTIARDIVEAHGGTTRLESDAGGWSEFVIEFPLE